MKLGFIQFDVTHNKQENFKIIERHLSKMDCDLVVLPELSTCGYLFESKNALKNAAEVIDKSWSVDMMSSLSKKYNCAIIFGMAEIEAEKIYNTAVIVHHGRFIGKYRKIHLSDFEKKLFDRGTSNEVFEVLGIKIGVQICFDLWFPEVSREQVYQNAVLLCALANFGGQTTYNITHTRAIENLTPIVLCNRIGNETLGDMNADFLGKSAVISWAGTPLITGQSGKEVAMSCTVEFHEKKSNVICGDFDGEIALHYAK